MKTKVTSKKTSDICIHFNQAYSVKQIFIARMNQSEAINPFGLFNEVGKQARVKEFNLNQSEAINLFGLFNKVGEQARVNEFDLHWILPVLILGVLGWFSTHLHVVPFYLRGTKEDMDFTKIGTCQPSLYST